MTYLSFEAWLDKYSCELDFEFEQTSEDEYKNFQDFAKDKYNNYVESMNDEMITRAGY